MPIARLIPKLLLCCLFLFSLQTTYTQRASGLSVAPVKDSSVDPRFSALSKGGAGLDKGFAMQRLETGADQTSRWMALVEGKRIGLVVNQTSRIDQQHLVDTLLALGQQIQVIFAPEHGFRGTEDAGAEVHDGLDDRTHLRVTSLYGANKKPTPEQLLGLDLLIFDIQDVGARFYTYISTLHLVMEACAEQGLALLVLDRPNPNGHYIDGPILDTAYRSFVGMHPIPVVHGMSIGELAQMINGERWLANGVKADLTVIPCRGWNHKKKYVAPIAPSPNLRTERSILLYPSLCFFEGSVVSVGRGTPWPFEVLGHPEFSIGGFQFTPTPGPGSAHPFLEGQACLGTSFQGISVEELRDQEQLMLGPLIVYHEFISRQIGKPFFLQNGFFDRLAGTDQLRLQLEAGLSEDAIRGSWSEGLKAFREARRPYLLYPD